MDTKRLLQSKNDNLMLISKLTNFHLSPIDPPLIQMVENMILNIFNSTFSVQKWSK